MSALSDYLAGPVTPERRAWWREAARQMDEMRALHAARDALPPAPMPLPPRDYGRATALFGAQTARALERVDNGGSLYDALYPDGDPEWDAFEAECATRAAEREANAELYRAQEEKAKLAYDQKRTVEKVVDESKRTMSRGKGIQKITRPCDRLYSCVGCKPAIPTTKHITSECWTQRDFLAGAVPVGCRWLHPGEPGWLPQWNTDRLYKPSAPPQHLMATALAGGAPAPRGPLVDKKGAKPSAPSFPWGKK